MKLDGDGFECDVESVDKSAYAEIQNILPLMTDLDSCEENIMKIFHILDLNKNNIMERCEDAKFQFAMGSSKEYALKFS